MNYKKRSGLETLAKSRIHEMIDFAMASSDMKKAHWKDYDFINIMNNYRSNKLSVDQVVKEIQLYNQEYHTRTRGDFTERTGQIYEYFEAFQHFFGYMGIGAFFFLRDIPAYNPLINVGLFGFLTFKLAEHTVPVIRGLKEFKQNKRIDEAYFVYSDILISVLKREKSSIRKKFRQFYSKKHEKEVKEYHKDQILRILHGV